MYIRLGNLTINQVADRLGITLTIKDRQWFKESRMDKVSDEHNAKYKIPSDTWHAFDSPSLQIHAGSQKMAKEVLSRLEAYLVDGSFPGELKSLSITHEFLEEEKFGYNQRKKMEDENLEIYVGYYKSVIAEEVRFFIKTRETKAKNIFLQELDIVTEGRYYSGQAVPNILKKKEETIYKTNEEGMLVWEGDNLIPIGKEQKAEIRRKRNSNEEYKIEESFKHFTIERWDGQPVPRRIEIN